MLSDTQDAFIHPGPAIDIKTVTLFAAGDTKFPTIPSMTTIWRTKKVFFQWAGIVMFSLLPEQCFSLPILYDSLMEGFGQD